jgi:hypothetical protein
MKTILLSIALISSLIACAAPPPVRPAGVPGPAPVPAIDPADGLPVLPAVPAAPVRAALDHVGVALAQIGGELKAVAPRTMRGGDMFLSSGRGGRTLIIQSSDPDPKAYANLEEDLNVMYQILSKTRKRDDGPGFQTRLEDITLRASGLSSVKSMYIENYGAIFMLGVRFPLVAPQAKDEQPKPKDTTSEEWNRAKDELYSGNKFEVDLDRIWTKFGPDAEEYDSQKVEDLTVGILEALKNGTHIRNLKSDEFITVAVLGAPSGAIRSVVEKDDDDGKGKVTRKTRVENVRSGTGVGESTMTIRAKKSDMDDFAKGKLNLDAFRKKAKTLVYLRPLDASGKMSVFAPVSPAKP